MKRALSLFTILITFLFVVYSSMAQDPNSPIWGIYASGVGERLKPGMDPCWITYTVALTTDPNIVANLGYGTMGAIETNISWREATALQRRFGRYFDDQPDGIFKLTSCETGSTSGFGIGSSGVWHGWGTMNIGCTNNSCKGDYSGTYVKSQKGTVYLYKKNGKWQGTWGEPAIGRKGILYDVSISSDGKTITGSYDTTVDGGRGNWHKGSKFKWTYRGPTIK